MNRFELMVPGKPKGKQRARHGQGRTFKPRDTLLAESEIRRAWQEIGSPRLEGALRVELILTVTRPAGHLTTRGELSAEGRRMLFPHRQKPDVDNALKLACDALNGLAYGDDVQIVEAIVYRRWGVVPATYLTVAEVAPREPEGTLVRLPSAVRAAA